MRQRARFHVQRLARGRARLELRRPLPAAARPASRGVVRGDGHFRSSNARGATPRCDARRLSRDARRAIAARSQFPSMPPARPLRLKSAGRLRLGLLHRYHRYHGGDLGEAPRDPRSSRAAAARAPPHHLVPPASPRRRRARGRLARAPRELRLRTRRPRVPPQRSRRLEAFASPRAPLPARAARPPALASPFPESPLPRERPHRAVPRGAPPGATAAGARRGGSNAPPRRASGSAR